MRPTFFQQVNPGIRDLTPYQPGKPIEVLQRELGLKNVTKLASNENPLGCSTKTLAAAEEALKEAFRYPDGSGYALKQALSKHYAIAPESITLGNGSDNILSLLMQTFSQEGDEVVLSQYAFASYVIFAKGFNRKPIVVPAVDYGHDLQAMAKAVTQKTKLIYIANPNNPTGTWNTHRALKDFLDAVPPHIIIVVDEAYFEFVQDPQYPDTLALQSSYPNLVTTRTFSKAYGMAGLRVGYAFSSPEIADYINRVRLPFNVSRIAQAAAVAAIQDQDHVQRTIELNQRGMQQLTDFFHEIGIEYIPSTCNFLTISLGENAQAIYDALLQEGVIVRPLSANDMPQHLRISIGTSEENQHFMKAIKKVLSL